MTGGMEGGRGGGGGCSPERDQRQPSRSLVSVEVLEQVEVWILNIERLHQGSIFSPMVTALKVEDRDGLSACSIPQT